MPVRNVDTNPEYTVKIGVVIPCFKVSNHIQNVLNKIGPEVERIYCVDDACPEGSGKSIESAMQKDARIRLIRHETNKGVGGAVLSGYQKAIEDKMEVIVKIDGDDQMDPKLILNVVQPILDDTADYMKGNRFYNLEQFRKMPPIRKTGNMGLSFLAKLSTGYWNIFDPTNGFTAISARVANQLPFENINKRYFFETDLLFRLNCLRAVVSDFPMEARYGDEKSNLNPLRELPTFAFRHAVNAAKRIFYNYFLRDFNIASINGTLGAILILVGALFGLVHWIENSQIGRTTPPGTVMIGALPIILGTQLILSFLNYDLSNTPRNPIGKHLPACVLQDNA